MMVYAVIDTNVLVSALLSRRQDSGVVIIRDYILEGKIVPVYNDEIYREYDEVLHRAKFGFPPLHVDAVLDAIQELGVVLDRTASEEVFPDPKDIVFLRSSLVKGRRVSSYR